MAKYIILSNRGKRLNGTTNSYSLKLKFNGFLAKLSYFSREGLGVYKHTVTHSQNICNKARNIPPESHILAVVSNQIYNKTIRNQKVISRLTLYIKLAACPAVSLNFGKLEMDPFPLLAVSPVLPR